MSISLDLDGYTFGVEIELTGLKRETAAAAVAEVLESQSVYAGGSYRKYTVTDRDGRTWAVMSDASIDPQKKSSGNIIAASDNYKCELVTPILRYSADMPKLQEIVRALKKAGGFVNASCGVHVHVGGEKHTARSLRNLANIFKSKQDMLYRALDVKSYRANYCKKLPDEFVDRLNKHKPDTEEKFADEVYKDYGGYDYNRSQHYSRARYFGVNFHAYYTKGTIELRMLNSTLHAGWIRTYVILAIAINNQAIQQKNASSKVTVSTNECFTFRTWLLRMGFIGSEYEVPRKLLLDNLEGNKAWRYKETTDEIVRGDAQISE